MRNEIGQLIEVKSTEGHNKKYKTKKIGQQA